MKDILPTNSLNSRHILQFVLTFMPDDFKKLTNVKKLKPIATPSIFFQVQAKKSQVN